MTLTSNALASLDNVMSELQNVSLKSFPSLLSSYFLAIMKSNGRTASSGRVPYVTYIPIYDWVITCLAGKATNVFLGKTHQVKRYILAPNVQYTRVPSLDNNGIS